MNNTLKRFATGALFSLIILVVQHVIISLIFMMLFGKILVGIRVLKTETYFLEIAGGIVVALLFYWVPYIILYFNLLKKGNFIEFYLFKERKIITAPFLLGVVNLLFYFLVSFLWLPILSGAFTFGYSEIPILPLYFIFCSIVILTPVLFNLLKIDRFATHFYNETISPDVNIRWLDLPKNKTRKPFIIGIMYSLMLLVLQVTIEVVVLFSIFYPDNRYFFHGSEMSYFQSILVFNLLLNIVLLWIPYTLLYVQLLKRKKKIMNFPLFLGIVNSLFYACTTVIWLLFSGHLVPPLGVSDHIPLAISYPIFFSIVILTPLLCRILTIDRFVVRYYNQSNQSD